MANEGGIVAVTGERVMWDVYTEGGRVGDLSTPLDLGEVIALVIVVFVSVFTFSLFANWTSCPSDIS